MTFFGKLCTSGAAGLAALLVASGAAAGSNCPADLNGDNQVDAADLAILLGAWGTPNADLTGDGTTNGADLAVLLGGWGPCPPPSVCPNPEHNCFVTGTAGCSDEDCCNAVCAADPFCCNNSWDSLCVNGALNLCGSESCGTSAGNDCCTTSKQPGCNDEICCNIVCTVDPFCCATAWDSLCVSEAEKLCGLDCGDPACGVPGTGDCCVANGTPFCDDAECCNLVCAADPFCCTNQWDGICASAAVANCGVCAPDPACGVPGTGDCCVANGTPFCDDAECCNLVCAADPFCCNNQWDGICANAAIANCGVCAPTACGSPNAGDCCVANGTPFCNDAACCNAVCGFDPFCCDTQWDGICADLAGDICAPCGGNAACNPNAGDCCVANGTPGCSDADCCLQICASDPFCCNNQWDGICANAAVANCAGCSAPACGSPNAGDCCVANGTPFCNDAACCNAVCGFDPFCCNTQWDSACANLAGDICAPCGGNAACNPNAGDCCVANGTPGCSDADCCLQICASDPFCCNNQWDSICANAAVANCAGCSAVCPNPEHGCFVTGSAGCSDADCCNAVCAVDPFCCNNSWDSLCVGTANDLCGNDACPNPAHACNQTGTPGCSDETCCNIVCSFDPFCCTTSWDSICVNGAATSCP